MENNMFCDLETGVCGINEEMDLEFFDFNHSYEKIDLYYFTDPICSHCWALEPVLRRFQEQYHQYFNFHTIMGGLLKSWDGFADVANGISSHTDVASHWKEVSEHSRMPIDGTLWIHHPIQSSYPASRIFKVIQEMDEKRALKFLRKTREAVFVFNQNVGEQEVLIEIVNQLGLNGDEIIKEASPARGQQRLEEDLEFARNLGVRGFPTIIMVNKENKVVKIVGARTFESYEEGLKEILAQKEELHPASPPPLQKLLDHHERLFSREVEEIYGVKRENVPSFVKDHLSPSHYVIKEILGEIYIERKK